MDLLCLVPMGLIASRMRASWRAKWFAVFIFSVGNWVGQDYFSPQSLNYLLYLFFIALLLIYFGRTGLGAPSGGSRRTGADRTAEPRGRAPRWRAAAPTDPGRPAGGASRARQVTMLSVLAAIFVFSTSSHQLTPFFMVAACAGLVIVRRCRLRGLPVLFVVIFTAWLSFAAVPYWSGHRSQLFGGLGDLGVNLSTSVSGRLAGSTPLHTLVLYSRTAFAGAVVVLAVAGLARRWRLGFDDRVALGTMCVSFAGFGLQSYGGEIALRVYLFALPGAALLVAYLFFPGLGGPGRKRRLPAQGRRAWRLLGAARDRRAWLVVPLAVVCSVVAVLLFFVARYGNEAFERTPAGELTAMNYLYAHDSAGIRVLWTSELPAVDDTPQIPWQYRDIARTDYIAELAPTSPTQVAGLVTDLRAMGPGSYLITTTTQETYLAQAANYPASWGGSSAPRWLPTRVSRSRSGTATPLLTPTAGLPARAPSRCRR